MLDDAEIIHLTYNYPWYNLLSMPKLSTNNSQVIKGSNRHRRLGRPPKWLTYSYDQCAEGAFTLAGRLIKYVNDNWDDLSFDYRIKSVSAVMPIAMKRIPEKHEHTLAVVNLNDELLLRVQSLLEEQRKQLPQVIDAQQLTSTGAQMTAAETLPVETEIGGHPPLG